MNACVICTHPTATTANEFRKSFIVLIHVLPSSHPKMAGRKSGGENTKKAAGNARKAEAAAAKQAVRDRESERVETEKWKQGAKDTSKAYISPWTYT